MTFFGLDNRTLLLVAGGFYLLLPPSIWLVLRMPRQQAPVLWLTGGLMVGMGLVLMSLRGQVPDELSYLVGQPIMALGAVLMAQSLRIDLGRSWPWWTLALSSMVYALLLWLLLPVVSVQTLGVLVRAVNFMAVLAVMLTAWQVARAESSRNAMLMTEVCSLQAAAILVNLVNASLGSDDIHTLANHAATVFGSLVMVLVSLALGMAYLGLQLERSSRKQLELAKNMAHAQQLQQQREILVRRDRERLLGLLADSLGHEALQPLTAALLRVQLALRQLRSGVPPAALQAGVDDMAQNIQRARDTVERVRAFVRPPLAQVTPVELRDVLGHVSRLLHQDALNRHLDLHVDHVGEKVWVMGDALQLAQAVVQVVRNAMSAVENEATRTIQVTLEMSAQQVRVKVSDSGPGLPANILQQRETATGGWPPSLQGMGLFVVQDILERHRGQLELRNADEGGAVVTLVLPRHTA